MHIQPTHMRFSHTIFPSAIHFSGLNKKPTNDFDDLKSRLMEAAQKHYAKQWEEHKNTPEYLESHLKFSNKLKWISLGGVLSIGGLGVTAFIKAFLTSNPTMKENMLTTSICTFIVALSLFVINRISASQARICRQKLDQLAQEDNQTAEE